MRIDHFDVVLNRGIDEPYIGGEVVKGTIAIHASKKIRIGGLHVKIYGVAETGWRNKNSDVSFESRETVMDEPLDLTMVIADHCNTEFELHEGMHAIPFEIKIPLDVISSVDRDNYGYVRYTCTAVLHLPEDGGSEFISEKSMKIWSLLNLDAPYLRESTSVTEEEELRGCCGRKRGMLTASLTVAETGLLPGETTKVTVTIENKTKKRRRWRKRNEEKDCVLISLCQQLDFVARNRYETDMCDRKSLTIAVDTHGTCKAQPGNGPQTKVIDFRIPPELPPTSIQANGLVTCSYFFKLDLDQFDIVVPVVLGSLKTPGPIE